MSDMPSTTNHDRVRATASATLIGATLMLFFGFLYLARPSGDSLFDRAALVLLHTLRLGGLVFLIIAGLLYTGFSTALVLDAVFAIPCGLILLGCGIVMGLNGGDIVNSIILVVSGLTFFPTGWRNANLYKALHRQSRISDNSHPS